METHHEFDIGETPSPIVTPDITLVVLCTSNDCGASYHMHAKRGQPHAPFALLGARAGPPSPLPAAHAHADRNSSVAAPDPAPSNINPRGKHSTVFDLRARRFEVPAITTPPILGGSQPNLPYPPSTESLIPCSFSLQDVIYVKLLIPNSQLTKGFNVNLGNDQALTGMFRAALCAMPPFSQAKGEIQIYFRKINNPDLPGNFFLVAISESRNPSSTMVQTFMGSNKTVKVSMQLPVVTTPRHSRSQPTYTTTNVIASFAPNIMFLRNMFQLHFEAIAPPVFIGDPVSALAEKMAEFNFPGPSRDRNEFIRAVRSNARIVPPRASPREVVAHIIVGYVEIDVENEIDDALVLARKLIFLHYVGFRNEHIAQRFVFRIPDVADTRKMETFPPKIRQAFADVAGWSRIDAFTLTAKRNRRSGSSSSASDTQGGEAPAEAFDLSLALEEIDTFSNCETRISYSEDILAWAPPIPERDDLAPAIAAPSAPNPTDDATARRALFTEENIRAANVRIAEAVALQEAIMRNEASEAERLAHVSKEGTPARELKPKSAVPSPRKSAARAALPIIAAGGATKDDRKPETKAASGAGATEFAIVRITDAPVPRIARQGNDIRADVPKAAIQAAVANNGITAQVSADAAFDSQVAADKAAPEQAAAAQQAATDKAASEQATADAAAAEQAAADKAASEQATADAAAAEQAAADKATAEQATADATVAEQVAADRATAEQAAADAAAALQAAADKAASELASIVSASIVQAAADKAASEQATADAAAAEEAATDKTSAEQTTADAAAAEQPAADKAFSEQLCIDAVAFEQATADKAAPGFADADATAAVQGAMDKAAAEQTVTDAAAAEQPAADRTVPEQSATDDATAGQTTADMVAAEHADVVAAAMAQIAADRAVIRDTRRSQSARIAMRPASTSSARTTSTITTAEVAAAHVDPILPRGLAAAERCDAEAINTNAAAFPVIPLAAVLTDLSPAIPGKAHIPLTVPAPPSDDALACAEVSNPVLRRPHAARIALRNASAITAPIASTAPMLP